MSYSQLPKLTVAGSTPVARSEKDTTSLRLVSICHTAADEYHGWEDISASQLRCLLKSPEQFYNWFVLGQRGGVASPSLSYGTILHAFWEVGNDRFWDCVVRPEESEVTATGLLTKKAEERRVELLLEDKFLLPPAEEQRLRTQTENLLKLRAVRESIDDRTDAECNIRFVWNGFACRCRIDHVGPGYLLDWKTTKVADPRREFWRSVLDYGYHLQAALYTQAAKAAGMGDVEMRFAITSTASGKAHVAKLPPLVIGHGKRECLRLLEELESRKQWNCWHDYQEEGVPELDFPAFALKGMTNAKNRQLRD